jgi:hypothetical protein
VGIAPAHVDTTIPAARLPAKPWTDLRTAVMGRKLIDGVVEPASVTPTTGPNGESSSVSAGGRIDLSCGRLDVNVGAPMLGPPPGPGVPGDCLP